MKALCSAALEAAFPGVSVPVIVTQATNAKFGDYQCNNAMSLFAKVKGKVRPGLRSAGGKTCETRRHSRRCCCLMHSDRRALVVSWHAFA